MSGSGRKGKGLFGLCACGNPIKNIAIRDVCSRCHESEKTKMKRKAVPLYAGRCLGGCGEKVPEDTYCQPCYDLATAGRPAETYMNLIESKGIA